MPAENIATKSSLPDKLSSGVDLRGHIVPLIRQWMQGGVSSENLKSSVRIQEINELSGGLKSPVVGTVDVSVKVIIKQGSEELLAHQQMMNEVNRRFVTSSACRGLSVIFPEVMHVDKISGFAPDRDHLMIQQALVKFDTAQMLVYSADEQQRQRGRKALVLGITALQHIHTIQESRRGPLGNLPRTRDPFTLRIASKLESLSERIDWLKSAMTKGLVVDGETMPALSTVLKELSQWQEARTAGMKLVLVHGDPHLANLMTRQRGRNESVRWIDPNPTVGFSDPAYDWGKLLHFVEPVGWAKQDPDAIRIQVSKRKSIPIIQTSLDVVNKEAEKGRQESEDITRSAAILAMESDSRREAALELAISSAHIGYATLEWGSNLEGTAKREAERRRDFAAALTLRALARWRRIGGSDI